MRALNSIDLNEATLTASPQYGGVYPLLNVCSTIGGKLYLSAVSIDNNHKEIRSVSPYVVDVEELYVMLDHR